MSRNQAPHLVHIEELDRFYRAGGLRRMAPPHVHYPDLMCPHPGCGHKMKWIDFQLEYHGDPQRIYKPLVTAWWDGTGFVGRCPRCPGWLHFTTLRTEPASDQQVHNLPRLPDNWHGVAQFG